jgi:asparagine synthase (glutamine-hydrolysing)
MCGIAGIVDPALTRDLIRPVVQRMTDALIHRGPDDDGFFVTDGVGLGMRRLSIIDVAGGQQPIANEDGLVQVVFNGEIYNYLELRNHLSQRGHVFRTNSDTEVIAHVYEERGVDGLTDLRGMFGIAVWDQRARRLLLARDRLGKKPLFYAKRGDRLLFGSEIKAILAADPTLAEADPEALLPYFQYGVLAEPRTMFRHIRKLPAASWLLYEDGEIQIAPYWRLNFSDDAAPKPKWKHVVEELDALLEEAVRIRLMSEVPLGVFLSGGLDSSTIVAYAHKAGLRPLKTFTIGFDRQGWDESADAALVARHFQTDHHVLMLREQDLAHELPQTLATLVSHFDEPFGDQSALPTYYVSKLAREHVTVILSGDGGDELFAGYNSYQVMQFAEYYRRVPRWLGADCLPALFEGGAQCLPAGQRYSALRVAKVLRDSRLPFEDMYWTKGWACRPELLRQLFTEDVKTHLGSSTAPPCSDDITAVMRSNLPVLSKATYASLRGRLLDGILVKVDRMSMAHSLEVRSPLLDHRLVEFVVGLPPSFKLRGWQTKAILRDTIRPYLPPATMRKGKQGFNVPLREWLRTGLNELVGDFLESAHGPLPPAMFDRAAVRRLLVQHRRGEADYSLPIWLLLNYAMWHNLYIDRGGMSAAAHHTSEVRDQIVA